MKNQKKSIIPNLIIGTFVLFALFIGYMVYQAFQSDVNLVQDDYYQNSTMHDVHVADIKRSNAVDIKLFFDRKKSLVHFEIPSEFDAEKVKGEVHFYRPSDNKLDFKIPIALLNGKQMLNTEKIAPGKWNVKASFSFEGKNYFKESSFSK